MIRHGDVLVYLFLAVGLIGCGKKEPEQNRLQQVPQELAEAHGMGAPNSVAGVTWSVPPHWTVAQPRQMRIATYIIPAAESDKDPAECGVFYFGNDQGGSVDANVDRWVNQFEASTVPVRSSKEVNGMTVALVQVSGTYLSPGGPMMQSQGKRENYRLLGAIVQAPEGSVFFKLTGPAKSVGAAEGDFNSLISSLGKK